MSHRIHATHRSHTPVATPSVDVDESPAAPRTERDGFEHEQRPTNWSAASTTSRTTKASPYNLTNRGGAVLSKPVINNIYVGDYWNSDQGKADAAHNDAFAADVMKSKYMSVLAQYGVGKGS